MGNRGRKRKPDALKDLAGTSRPDRSSDTSGIISGSWELPATPSLLNNEGKQIYRKLGSHLAQYAILNELTYHMFVALCREMGVYMEAEATMKYIDDRYDVLTDKEGNTRTVLSAKHLASKQALEQARKLATEFGMTPATISKLAGIGRKQKSDFEKDFD